MRKLSDYKETYCMRAGSNVCKLGVVVSPQGARSDPAQCASPHSTRKGEGCAPQLPPTVLSAFFCGPFWKEFSGLFLKSVLQSSLQGRGNVSRFLKEKLFGKFASLSVCQHACPSHLLLGEVDPVFKSCHPLQKPSVIKVHVVGKVCTNSWLHVAQSAVERGPSHAEENCGYAQQDEQDAGATADLIWNKRKGQRSHRMVSSGSSPAFL